jgi:hypothetical protein
LKDHSLFEFLCGSLLGDGSLECEGQMARYAEAQKNTSYGQWKHQALAPYFPISGQTKRTYDKRTGKHYEAYWLRTTRHPLLTEWFHYWYSEKKRIPRDVVKRYLTARALAIWFYDDGHLDPSGAHFYPMAFPESDVMWLQSLLESRFGLASKLRHDTKGRSMIRIPFRSRNELLELLRKTPCPGMAYKRGEDSLVEIQNTLNGRAR